MKTIQQPDRFVVGNLIPQQEENGIKYVKSPYVIECDTLMFNTLTYEAIDVKDKEQDKTELIKRWFYIPEGMDLSSFDYLLRQRQRFSMSGPGSNLKHTYVIFTTTACNAACTYCFEKDYPVFKMTNDIADKVSEYILKTVDRKAKKIWMRWFGGEPLVNKEVITSISNVLIENGINFSGGLSSNGDLLNNCTDKELVDIWKIDSIQFTADHYGTKYDLIKGLPDGAYKRLHENVKRVNELGIHARLRLHLSELNDLETLKHIVDDFKSYKNLSIYTRLLYNDFTHDKYEKLLELDDYIERCGKYTPILPSTLIYNHCMADSRKIVCITPDGSFSPCEHFAFGDQMYGSLFKRVYDENILKQWKIREKYQKEECKACPLYPSCKKIINCPSEGDCSNGYKYYQIETIKRALRRRAEKLNVSSGIRS